MTGLIFLVHPPSGVVDKAHDDIGVDTIPTHDQVGDWIRQELGNCRFVAQTKTSKVGRQRLSPIQRSNDWH